MRTQDIACAVVSGWVAAGILAQRCHPERSNCFHEVQQLLSRRIPTQPVE